MLTTDQINALRALGTDLRATAVPDSPGVLAVEADVVFAPFREYAGRDVEDYWTVILATCRGYGFAVTAAGDV